MVLRSLALGFAIGSSVTALAAYALRPSPEPVAMSAASSTHPHADARQAQRPGISTSTANPPSDTVVRTPSVGSAHQPTVPAPAAPVLGARSSSGGTGTSMPSIALSREHAKVLAPTTGQNRQLTLAELHMQLVSEAKDDNWGTELEQSIRAFLTAKNSPPEFDIMSVECRTTLCEILAFGNLPTSGERWNELWNQAHAQPWYGEISGNSTSTFVNNQRYVIVTILHRSAR